MNKSPLKKEKIPALVVWQALFWGAFAGIMVFMLALIVANLTARRDALALSVLDVFLRVISPLFLVGFTAGIVSYVRLAKHGWIPHLTWLLLMLLYLIAYALGSLLANIIIVPFNITVNADRVLQIITPILIFGVWILLSHLAIQAIIQQPSKRTKVVGRHVGLLLGQLLLAIFVAASWLPGTGSLILGGTIGLIGMISLALFGVSRQAPEMRTPAFLITLWTIPALTIIAMILVISLGW